MNFNAGLVRSYLYELMDEGTDPNNREKHFGLVRDDGTMKPSFVALRNEIALLRGAAAGASEEASLSFGLSGGGPALQHTLLRAGNGDFYLVLWLEMASTDADTSVPVRLTLDRPSSEVQTFLPLLSSEVQARFPAGSSFDLRVPDHPLIVKIVH